MKDDYELSSLLDSRDQINTGIPVEIGEEWNMAVTRLIL